MSQLTDAATALKTSISAAKTDAAAAESILAQDLATAEADVTTLKGKVTVFLKTYGVVSASSVGVGYFGPDVLKAAYDVLKHVL